MSMITKYIEDIYRVFIKESSTILRDSGILLIASLAIIIYGFLYSYSYSPEVLESVPIAVVDMDNSTDSRELSRRLDSTPNVEIKYNCSSLSEAKELMVDSKVLGILYIQDGFAKSILSNRTAYFSVYTDGSYFLAYKQFFLTLSDVLVAMNADIKYERYTLSGQSSHTAEYLSQPITVKKQFLYNRVQGYGSFLMPAILILIIQQTIVISCGMVWGKSRERGFMSQFTHNPITSVRYNPTAVVLGRSIYYLLNNLLLWGFVITFIYTIFDFPSNGRVSEVFALMVPYILSSAFLGIGMSVYMRYRESVILFYFFSSIPLLLLSGISWPSEGMPQWLYELGKLSPSTSAIDGFIRLQTTGADLAQVSSQYYTLWMLTVLYFIFATISVHYGYKRDKESSSQGDINA